MIISRMWQGRFLASLALYLVASCAWSGIHTIILALPAGTGSATLNLLCQSNSERSCQIYNINDAGDTDMEWKEPLWQAELHELEDGCSSYLATLQTQGVTGSSEIYFLYAAVGRAAPGQGAPQPEHRKYSLEIPPPPPMADSQTALMLYHQERLQLFNLVSYPSGFQLSRPDSLLWQERTEFSQRQQEKPPGIDNASIVSSGYVYHQYQHSDLTLYHLSTQQRLEDDSITIGENPDTGIVIRIAEQARLQLPPLNRIQPRTDGIIRLRPAKRLVLLYHQDDDISQESRIKEIQAAALSLETIDPLQAPTPEILALLDQRLRKQKAWLVYLPTSPDFFSKITPDFNNHIYSTRNFLRLRTANSPANNQWPANLAASTIWNLDISQEKRAFLSYLRGITQPEAPFEVTVLSQRGRFGFNLAPSRSSTGQASAAIASAPPQPPELSQPPRVQLSRRNEQQLSQTFQASASLTTGYSRPAPPPLYMNNPSFWVEVKGGGTSPTKCTICLENIKECVTTNCGHMYCLGCLRSSALHWSEGDHRRCPACRTLVNHVVATYPEQPELPSDEPADKVSKGATGQLGNVQLTSQPGQSHQQTERPQQEPIAGTPASVQLPPPVPLPPTPPPQRKCAIM